MFGVLKQSLMIQLYQKRNEENKLTPLKSCWCQTAVCSVQVACVAWHRARGWSMANLTGAPMTMQVEGPHSCSFLWPCGKWVSCGQTFYFSQRILASVFFICKISSFLMLATKTKFHKNIFCAKKTKQNKPSKHFCWPLTASRHQTASWRQCLLLSTLTGQI